MQLQCLIIFLKCLYYLLMKKNAILNWFAASIFLFSSLKVNNLCILVVVWYSLQVTFQLPYPISLTFGHNYLARVRMTSRPYPMSWFLGWHPRFSFYSVSHCAKDKCHHYCILPCNGIPLSCAGTSVRCSQCSQLLVPRILWCSTGTCFATAKGAGRQVWNYKGS